MLLRAGCAASWLAVLPSTLSLAGRLLWHAYLSSPSAPTGMTLALLALSSASVLAGEALTVALVQVAVLGAWVVLSFLRTPSILFDPFGPGKTLAWIAIATAPWLLAQGRDRAAATALRLGIAIPWITEGFFSKVVLQQPLGLLLVQKSGLPLADPSLFLRLLGCVQVLAGFTALIARGRLFRWLIIVLTGAIVVFTALLTLEDPQLWIHPLGPIAKSVPFLAGGIALVLLH